MSTIGKAQGPAGVVVEAKEHRSVGLVGCILVKETVYGLQKTGQIIQRKRILTAQVCLQIGHQQRPRYAFARDVRQDHAQRSRPQIEKVVIITTNRSCLDTTAGILKCLERRQLLGKHSGLDPTSNVHLDGDTPFCLQTLRDLFGELNIFQGDTCLTRYRI